MNRRNEQRGAVIIGSSLHSLGAVRNLAMQGIPVCVLSSGACVSQFSKFVRIVAVLPDRAERYFSTTLL